MKEINFNIDKTVQYWLNGSLYDLETGKSLLESKRYPYALFLVHLAIEKLLRLVFLWLKQKLSKQS